MKYVDALENEKSVLNEALKMQTEQLARAESAKPLLPGWVWFVIGAATGVTAIGVLK